MIQLFSDILNTEPYPNILVWLSIAFIAVGMAANFWDNSDADNDANNLNNWSLGNVPTGTDVATFDNTSDDNCTFSGNISCAGINVTSLYDGNIDMVTYNLTTSGDMTFDGTGIFDCGTGTLTCSGNFDNKDQGTWTRGTSNIVLNGTGKTLISSFLTPLYSLTIDGTITLSSSTVINCTVINLNINSGTFTISEFMLLSSLLTLTGNLAGTDTLRVNGGGAIDFNGGSVAAGLTMITHDSVSITGAGSIGGTWTFRKDDSQNRTLTFGAGPFAFSGDVTFAADNASNVYTVDLEANDTTIEFQGDLTLTEVGELEWKKPLGTGTVTFGGTTTYTDNTAAIQNLGDVDADGTSLRLITEMECDDFTGTSGSFDPNGQTLDATGNVAWGAGFDGDAAADAFNGCTILVGGNFTANGQTLKATAGWTLTVTGTAVASGVGAVAHSNAGGGTEITASAGPWTDNLNNTNWDFGVVAPTDGVARLIFLTGEVA